MDAQELRNLQEAYLEVVENQQQLDEVLDTPEKANEYARKNVRSMLGAFAKGVANKDISQLKTINKRTEGAKRAKRKAERKAAEEQKESFDIYDIILSHLLDEGYVNDEKSAFAIMANMSESWKQSILEMDDFAAGGGNAKMKKTGMTRDQVVALGKKNLAAKPASSSSSSGKSSGSTSSDVVRDRLASTEKYRQGVFKIPSKAERVKSAQDQEAKFDAYQKKQRESGYYKTGYKNLPGTFKNG